MPPADSAAEPSESTPVRRRSLWRGGEFLLWSLALSLAVFAVAWQAGFAPWSLLRWINAFTVYVYLPAYLGLIVAIVARRVRLMACFTAICAWHASLVLPVMLPIEQGPTVTAVRQQVESGQRIELRLFYANVGKTNDEVEPLFEELRRSDADVLVLTEFTEAWVNKFNGTELPADYPHHVHLFDYSPAATAIYSRLPLTAGERVFQEKRVMVQTTVDLGRAELRLFALHAPRPVKSPLHRYEEFWEIAEEEIANQEGPLIVVGDFNASPFSQVLRRLTGDLGLRDCHQLRGRGAATTWPNGARALPPIRIDHVLVSQEIECIGIGEGAGLGSDHNPIEAVLAIPAAGRGG